MSISLEQSGAWLTALKTAWEAGDGEAAIALFTHTKLYYERPFKAGTTQDDIRKYWQDIDGLEQIKFDYKVIAVEGNRAIVHWQNSFISGGEKSLLDGVFFVDFDEEGHCVEFRQWWFAA